MHNPVVIIVATLVAIVIVAILRGKPRKENHSARHRNNGASRNTDVMRDIRNFPADLHEAVKDGRKLDAIKLYKKYAGCSLAEARDAIESIMKED